MGEPNLSLAELQKPHHKINKKVVKEVNRILEKLDMVELWRKLNGDRREYTFSKWYMTPTQKLTMYLGRKTSQSNVKRQKY